MNLPDYFYSKAFWESISLSAAGLIGLLVTAGMLPVEYLVPSATILAGVLGFLKFFDVDPQVKARREALLKAKKSKK